MTKTRLLLAVALAGAGCSKGPAPSEDLAEVVLSLVQAPTDVSCIAITLTSTQPQKQMFNVTPGGATSFSISRLPVGPVVISVDAFPTACSAVTGSTPPTWTGGPVSVVLKGGANLITIQMKRVGQVTVSVDFDPAPVPMCAANSAACVANADCCSNRCVIASGDTIGQCQAAMPPPPPAGPSVQLNLVGGKNYLLYAIAGGPGCSTANTKSIIVPEFEGACVPPDVGDVIPVTVAGISVCQAGGGCQPCNNGDNCNLPSCFQQIESVPADPGVGPCGVTLPNVMSTIQYLLFRKIDVHNPPARPEGLPRLIHSTTTGTVTITPAAAHQTFVVAELGPPLFSADNGGDTCGGLGLCGIIPYSAVGGFGDWSFFTGLSLYSSPLF
jgi:hypothetical protein